MTENNTFYTNTAMVDTENNAFAPTNEQEENTVILENPSHGVVKRVDLTEYAIDESGAHKGDANALKIKFDEIRSGHLIDESEDFDYQEKYRIKLADEIIQLEKDSEEMVGEKLKIKEVNIPKLKSKMLELEKELHDWSIKLQLPAEKDIINKFTLWKYGVCLVFGLIYILSFYISCVYMGMVRNPMAEAEKLYQSGGEVNSLFSAIFSMKAFLVFDFHYFSPILLMLFAVLLDHINETQKGYKRIAGLAFFGMITLVLDAFIAFKIENTNYEMKKLMGIEDPSHLWYLSSDFYIVLIMGFVATLAWGILLIAFKKELQKTDHKKIIGLEMSFLKKCLGDVKNEIMEMELALQDLETKLRKVILDIKKLSERKSDLRISIPKLERYISKFFAGWMEYVAIKKNETIKKECYQVYENFRERYIKHKDPDNMQGFED